MGRRSTRVKKKPQLIIEGMEYDGSTPLPDVKHELFCALYTSNSTPRFFGHGQNCYAFAFGYMQRLDELEIKLIGADTRTGRGKKRHLSVSSTLYREKLKVESTCRTNGARLLTNANILTRCNFLMDKLIDDKIVDRELAFVIQQRYDLSSKTQAITHFDKKRGRLIERQESLIKFEPITSIEFVMPVTKHK